MSSKMKLRIRHLCKFVAFVKTNTAMFDCRVIIAERASLKAGYPLKLPMASHVNRRNPPPFSANRGKGAGVAKEGTDFNSRLRLNTCQVFDGTSSYKAWGRALGPGKLPESCQALGRQRPPWCPSNWATVSLHGTPSAQALNSAPVTVSGP